MNMMINTVIKQKTSDEEFQSFNGIIQPTILAYNYVVGGKRGITLDMVMKADMNEILLKPYIRAYIKEKEKKLGKRKLLFTQEEIDETLEELEGLYHTLKSKGILY